MATGSPVSQASLELRARISVLPTPPKFSHSTSEASTDLSDQNFILVSSCALPRFGKARPNAVKSPRLFLSPSLSKPSGNLLVLVAAQV